MRNVDKWALHYAALKGDVAGLTALLDEGVDPNAFDDAAFTPLHHAAEKEHLQAVTVLLQRGADVNAHDESRIGDNPLGQVAGHCSLAMAKLLIDAGADPTIRGWMQLCALDRASERKKPEGRQVYDLLCKAAARLKKA
jgi:ankyrin repeat protein